MEKETRSDLDFERRLYSSEHYWMDQIQNELYRQLKAYMKKESLNQSELAKELGFSKGYISKVLNGEFNHSLKKLIQLALKIGVAPTIRYTSIAHLIDDCKLPKHLSGAIMNLQPDKLEQVKEETEDIYVDIEGDYKSYSVAP